MCDGTGACQSAAELCPQSPTGTVQVTCDSLCQDPNLSTCLGTTAGACANVDAGDQTCGVAVCEVTSPVCLNGLPQTCTPNWAAASTETCNDIDDDCSGAVDDGAFTDGFEPNGNCGNETVLANVASNQTRAYTTQTIYGQGDFDYYRFVANETDSSCSCCDFFCTDEDYRLRMALTVPPGAGSYEICTGSSCSGVTERCQTVSAGQTLFQDVILDGACPATDNYQRFVRIRGLAAPAHECNPYQLTYQFTPGCF